jgi:hypothetical protein
VSCIIIYLLIIVLFICIICLLICIIIIIKNKSIVIIITCVSFSTRTTVNLLLPTPVHKILFCVGLYEQDLEKYGRVRQATYDDIIRRVPFACFITKATDTHLEYVIRVAFPQQLVQ